MVAGLLQGSKVAGKFKDFMPLLKSSATGGLFSGGLTALFTGNPLAGLAVGAADTLGSAALATGIGALGTRKVLGKNINFAGGKKYTFSESDDLDPLKKQLANLGQAGTAARVGKAGQIDPQAMKAITDYAQSKSYYAPSGPQLAGMYATSIAAPFAIEPLFMPRSQNYITNPQSMQTYGMNQNINSMSTQAMTGQSMNLSPGTLYQLSYSPLSNLSTAFAAQSEKVIQ